MPYNKNLILEQRKIYKNALIISVTLWLFSFILLVKGNNYSIAGVILGALSFVSAITFSIKYMHSSKHTQSNSSFGELTLIVILVIALILIFALFSLFSNFGNT